MTMDKDAKKANLHALVDCIVTVAVPGKHSWLYVRGRLCKDRGSNWTVNSDVVDVEFLLRDVDKVKKALYEIELRGKR